MTKRRKRQRPEESYTLLIQARAYPEIRRLPGHIRRQAQQAIEHLKTDPRPSNSRDLKQDITSYEARRLRLGQWRILYVIDEIWKEIAVVAIRQRPPYQYEDLEQLLSELDDN